MEYMDSNREWELRLIRQDAIQDLTGMDIGSSIELGMDYEM